MRRGLNVPKSAQRGSRLSEAHNHNEKAPVMETTEGRKSCETKKYCCPCHFMFGVFIALGGVIGLLEVFGVISHRVAVIIGSILLILAGLQTLMRSKCKYCDAA
jgi:hypothetical protein